MEWREHIARFGKAWFPGEPWARWTFIAFFLLATVLRCWDLPNIGYTHDELSALSRIYPSLVETVQHGVIELDTHPPGVQVFEWVWTRSFGFDEGVVKFPFIVFSLLAIFLLYRVAMAWTSAATALMVTALMATLQYSVMYGQIARPYAFGLFATALLADQLTRYLAHGGRNALITSGVAILLCAYGHHFSLLLAAIMVVTIFGILQPEKRKAYLLMCLLVALAYLPNVPIFLKQLSYGGLAEWLPAPDKYWIGDHLRWLMHYSLPLGIVCLLALVLAGFQRIKGAGAAGPSRWFLAAWGILPFAIAWGYSIWRAPVLQYSVLLFSFPYVLMALFAGLRTVDRRLAIGLSVVVACLASLTLFTERHHAAIVHGSIYSEIVEKGAQLVREKGTNEVLLLIDAPAPQIEFYVQHHDHSAMELPYHQLRDTDVLTADSLIRKSNSSFSMLGITNGALPERIANVQAAFPFLWARKDMVEGSVLLFGKEDPGTNIDDRELIAHAVPGFAAGGVWDIHSDLPIERDSSSGVMLWNFDGREFGLCCVVGLDSLGAGQEDVFELEIDVEPYQGHTRAMVAAELIVGDSAWIFRAGQITDMDASKGCRLVTTVFRSQLPRGASDVKLKTYMYNLDKGTVRVSAMRVLSRRANPVQNALMAPIREWPARTW